ncbi:UNVERIFIED_CONTAM: hypothetical protein FKN15_047659 [Acipenser sinensis]
MMQEESEDDQESFILQRKVKKTKNKDNGSSGLDEKGINLSNCKGSVVLIDVQTPVDNKMSMNHNKALEIHVHVGNISQVPVLRDEEKEVIHEFCVVNKHLADGLLVAILTKLKIEKKSMKSCYRQALCRVYVGICRQNGDLERACLFSYSILKEGHLGQLGLKKRYVDSVKNVATVINMFGRHANAEGQLGLKKRYVDSVKNVATVINMFGRHANAEDVPWGVQLATVYTIYDLAPSNPKEAMESLTAWRSETTRTVLPAVTSCITQMGSMCRQIS